MKEGIIPKHPSSVMVSGKVGSGKSNLLCSLFCNPQFYGLSDELKATQWQKEKAETENKYPTKFHYFDVIYMISPTANKGDQLTKHLLKHGNLEKKNIINSFDEIVIMDIYNKQQHLIEKYGGDIAPRVCVILDDIQSSPKFLRSDALKHLFLENRHLSMTIYLCGQSIRLTPRSLRIQANNIIAFAGQRSEEDRIIDDYCCQGLSKKEFREIFYHATKEPYSFIHININHPAKTRYRKNLDEILELQGGKFQ
jgi:hypothetical protein